MNNINIQIKNPYIIGKIGAPNGILGIVKLFSFTEKKSDIFKYCPWFIKQCNKWIILDLEYKKQNKNFFLIKIKHIKNRTEAQKLTNYHIMIEKSILPILKKNEYYWNDLLNCTVVSITGYNIGIVYKIIKTKSNDVLVIKNHTKKTKKVETLIPFLEGQFIKNVDILKKTITVDWNLIFE